MHGLKFLPDILGCMLNPMYRRAFLATIGAPLIPIPDPHADLRDLHTRWKRAWDDGREIEADALTFQLRNVIARKGLPEPTEQWREAWNCAAIYVVLFRTPLTEYNDNDYPEVEGLRTRLHVEIASVVHASASCETLNNGTDGRCLR
jgi:hypothetical protein